MTQTKRWYARIDDGSVYGKWKPTGCIDKQDAIDYLSTYYGVYVKEWLLL